MSPKVKKVIHEENENHYKIVKKISHLIYGSPNKRLAQALQRNLAAGLGSI